MNELKTATAAFNMLVILVLIVGFFRDPSCCGAPLRYLATVLMVMFPSVVSVITIVSTRGELTVTKPPPGLQWKTVIKILALAANGIYLLLVITTIVEGKFNLYVALLALVYALSFFVFWRDWQASKLKRG